MSYTPKHLTPGPKHLKKHPKPKWTKYLGEAAYYLALALFVLAVFLLRGAGDKPTSVLGFSAMRVLTTSMGEDLPQGSLIITHEVPPETLEVGDDVTYLAGGNTPITHRIVDVLENYAGSGQRAFITQGTANPSPDSLTVPSQNIVGKVVFHSLVLGQLLAFIRAYWLWILLLLALSIGLWKCLQIIFQENRAPAEKSPKKSERGEDQHEI